MALIVNIPPATSGSGGTSSLSVYLARAQQLTGVTDLAFYFDDFVAESSATAAVGWAASVAGSGSVRTDTAAVGGGLVRLATGATGASTAEIFSNANIVQSVTTRVWYFAARMRINTTPDAATLCGVGIEGGAKSIMCGFFGSIDAANWVLQYDGLNGGSKISLGLAVDTGFHIFEAWGTASAVINATMDSRTPVNVTAAAGPAAAVFFDCGARNGATAANQSMDIDWYLGAGGRT